MIKIQVGRDGEWEDWTKWGWIEEQFSGEYKTTLHIEVPIGKEKIRILRVGERANT